MGCASSSHCSVLSYRISLCTIANHNTLKNKLTNKFLSLSPQIDMIRNFLVLALPLAISAAASSNAATDAGFDADAVDLKANIIASINQFEGNRREMFNNAFRDLYVTDQCVAESEAITIMRDIVSPDVSDAAFLSSSCTKSGTIYTCDVTAQYAGVKDACEEEGGQTIGVKITMTVPLTAEGGGQSVTAYIMENMSACIGASCDAKEFINYAEDNYNDNLDAEAGFSAKVESGAQSTRMHYGAAAVSALVMAGVAFLN